MASKQTELERWRDKADEYRQEVTELGKSVIELEAEVQRLLARIAELETDKTCPVDIRMYYETDMCSLVIYCQDEDDSAAFDRWMHQRMRND